MYIVAVMCSVACVLHYDHCPVCACKQCLKISVLIKRWNRKTKREAVLKCSASSLYLLAKLWCKECCEMSVHMHMFTRTYIHLYIYCVNGCILVFCIRIFCNVFIVHVCTCAQRTRKSGLETQTSQERCYFVFIDVFIQLKLLIFWHSVSPMKQQFV